MGWLNSVLLFLVLGCHSERKYGGEAGKLNPGPETPARLPPLPSMMADPQPCTPSTGSYHASGSGPCGGGSCRPGCCPSPRVTPEKGQCVSCNVTCADLTGKETCLLRHRRSAKLVPVVSGSGSPWSCVAAARAHAAASLRLCAAASGAGVADFRPGSCFPPARPPRPSHGHPGGST